MARRTDGSAAPMLSVLTFNTGLTEIRLFGAALYEDVPHVIARAAHLAPALRRVDADIVLLQELVPQRVKKQLAAALRDLYPHAPVSRRTPASMAPGCSPSPAIRSKRLRASHSRTRHWRKASSARAGCWAARYGRLASAGAA